jgi:hypothetical protein
MSCGLNPPIKVGISGNHKNRLAYMRTHSHLELSLYKTYRLSRGNAIHLERVISKELEKFRIRGEWFNCNPSLVIETVKNIAKKTNQYRDWTFYQKPSMALKKPWLSSAAKAGGDARSANAQREFWERFSIIKDRWHLEDSSYILMKEAGIGHHDTIRVNLGYTRWEWRKMSDAKRARVLKQKEKEYRNAQAN